MTPDQLFAALATQDRLPREAMAAAGERRDEMIPVFLDHMERVNAATVETLTDEDRDACLFVCFLLAEWREPRAYRPLTKLLRRDPELLDLVLGDALTEVAARMIAGVFDGDLQPIFDVIEDEEADEFARAQMFDALVIIAHRRPLSRPAVAAYLEAFFSLKVAKSEVVWGSWAFSVADLGLAHLEPQARQAFEREWVSPHEATFEHFQKQLRNAVEGGVSDRLSQQRNIAPIDNAVEELSGWYGFSEEYLKARAKRGQSSVLTDPYGDPFRHEGPKVGRNDPCPCGSGKKYKKCCLP